MRHLRRQNGLGAVALIVALLIVALVYFGYYQMQDAMQAPRRATTTIDASKAFACKSNRQTAEREVQMWLVNPPARPPRRGRLDGALPEGEYRSRACRFSGSKHG
jgi:hypothetical protein